MVRWGKSSRGSGPKRRTVLLVPEMDWWIPVIHQWMTEVRPGLSPAAHPALWITERRGRLDWRGINVAFTQARDAAGLDPVLDLHSLRHSYVTHLIEFDYPEQFNREQDRPCLRLDDRHLHQRVADDYRNTLLRRALAARTPHMWERGWFKIMGADFSFSCASPPVACSRRRSWCRCWQNAVSTCRENRFTAW